VDLSSEIVDRFTKTAYLFGSHEPQACSAVMYKIAESETLSWTNLIDVFYIMYNIKQVCQVATKNQQTMQQHGKPAENSVYMCVYVCRKDIRIPSKGCST